MKVLKLSVIMIAVALLGLGLASTSYAFHSGGVAECDGCHTMHNSLDNAAMTTNSGLTQFHAGPYLLQGSTQSEACLNCHQETADTGPSSYHISTSVAHMAGNAPLEMTPGGDFGWIRNDIPFSERKTPETNFGAHRGHSINAPAFGYNPASGTAPGGTYDAANLACSSCHDPHNPYRRTTTGIVTNAAGTAGLPIIASGSYDNSSDPQSWGAVGVYRILRGPASVEKSTSYAFTAGPPDAVVPSSYNRTEATTQTRVAYGRGMAEWCANCHASMLMNGYTSGMSGLVHPAGNSAKLTSTIITNYQTYVKSGDMSGSAATSFQSLVPFEEGVTDSALATYTTLKTHAKNNDSVLTGPDANSNVMCLSCHRAHASGFQSMVRFGHENEFMTIADASGNAIYDSSTTEGKINRGLTVAEQTSAYYGRPATNFAPYQRLLCNKCHAKD